MEWNTNGEGLSLADYTLMKAWGANCVRVSLKYVFLFITSYSLYFF